MRKTIVVLLLLFACSLSHAQSDADCQLDIGVNLGGLADFGTELPFVNLMRNAREWYTKDVGNPQAAFNSEQATNLSYRPDGYPTHVPQNIPESVYPQEVVTIWGDTRGWPAGEYVVLWEGTGSFRLFGSFSNLTTTGPHRMTFDLVPQEQGIVELAIETSDINDPIRNIRLLMPGAEATYEEQPFNPVFIDKLQSFQTVRFMDWGQTNNWGEKRSEGWNNPNEFDWAERSQMDHYTWAYEKGIPYEMMVKLLNDYDLDGWICVPHRASPEYSQSLAEFMRDSLEPERHLYVEYSNELWNWIFGQAQWLNYYGCEQTGTSWPEGLVPYIQRCLDAFTTAFAGQTNRITRVVGTQLSWVDVSQRIANNLREGSFDAITPTCYFGFTDAAETTLDQLGESATAADIIEQATISMSTSFGYVSEQKTEVADPLGLPLVFYEGGQHLTPNPFGVYPSYGEALVDAQRSPGMYDLYTAWFDSLRTLQTGTEPLRIMHFSFVSSRNAQYGSWGMLETMDQDTSNVPAPKYQAILENMAPPECRTTVSTAAEAAASHSVDVFPNPVLGLIQLRSSIASGARVSVWTAAGKRVQSVKFAQLSSAELDLSNLPQGMYLLRIDVGRSGGTITKRIIKQ
ncbi:T9SS type A sorting domain-containing protein [Neolewinella aurantiaca]|uniref:T9SS type A sorting domain-containing protein n=1 Tax=Neolewinella aurantiaca TaxID=2602767 RepID=A0A5C7FDC5_9BACT|nr:T9SS type A sorting domain-containing protein [Neolewinella aurantiaca]TXF88154.1 T9SS type A sorting domain-containing protein [Neolewinella aurantiaca]